MRWHLVHKNESTSLKQEREISEELMDPSQEQDKLCEQADNRPSFE